MSEPNPPLSLDDRAALQAIRTLEETTHEQLIEQLRAGEEETFDRVREYTEILGMLPWALEAATPRPEVLGRIRASLAGDETQRVTLDQLRPTPPAASATRPVTAPERPAVQGMAPVPRAASADALPTPVSSPPANSRWLPTLAAALAVCVLGLGYAVGTLRADLAAQKERVDLLSAELEAARTGQETAFAASEDFEGLRARLALVTDLGTAFCALKPPTEGEAVQPQAKGVMFVASDHEHWYLRAEGLEPVGSNQTYQLWFVANGAPVSAGTFTAAADREIELGSPQMPDGTRAVLVTIEPEGGAEEPTGPTILYGDETMQFIS